MPLQRPSWDDYFKEILLATKKGLLVKDSKSVVF